ncbi:MAG TPA: DUF4019 domain-containing protein [Gemmatimonadaceae bacterium]|jgi:hypothetical protein
MSEYDPAAERAALQWLALTDEGDARESWAAAASLFRRAVSEEQWAAALDVARTPLGALISRRMESARSVHELPGAPDGDYVIFEFASQFAQKRSALETVTPMRDSDGQWRVSGYYIR